MHEFCIPNIRCDSMHNGSRCAKSLGHSGWHTSGPVEWLEQQVKATLPQCRVVIHTAGQEVRCTEPSGHRGAHRGSNLIWTDPTPQPEEL